MNELVRLWKRPCKKGRGFKYVLIWYDESGKERWHSLGHTDARKAEQTRIRKERELRLGIVEPNSMRLSEFLDDFLMRTDRQVRDTTLAQHDIAMRNLINIIGDIDFQNVNYRHGEIFMQKSLDKGKSPATVNKDLRSLKRMFQLAVNRGQLYENPLKRVPLPKVPRRKVRVYSDKECIRILQAARELSPKWSMRWDILILTALCTGMRRGELLNTTWRDIDFSRKVIDVSPKQRTDHTWRWDIKDTDRRALPVTEDVIGLLAEHQAIQPEGYPYVFIPSERYDHIRKLQQEDKWTVKLGQCPVNNFTRDFGKILKQAGVDHGSFHDLRRTCLTNLFDKGLDEFDVMSLAGHAEFETTRRFYLAIRDDLLQRARNAMQQVLNPDFIAISLQKPFLQENQG